MKKFFTFFLVCAFPFIFSVSCKKDDSIPPSRVAMLPVKITCPTGGEEHSVWYEITYDEYERLSEVYHYYGSGESSHTLKTTLFYDEQGVLLREEYSERLASGEEEYYQTNYTTRFTYEGKSVKVEGRYNGTLTLDDYGRMVEREDVLLPSTTIRYRYESQGNLNAYGEKYDEGFEYDMKNGIYRWINTPSWYMTCLAILPMRYNVVNNCTASFSGKRKIFGYEYTYNEYDYPLTQKRSYFDPDYFFCDNTGREVDGTLPSYEIEYQPSQRFWCGTE